MFDPTDPDSETLDVRNHKWLLNPDGADEPAYVEARDALVLGASRALSLLLGSVTCENASARLGSIGRLSTTLSKALIEAGATSGPAKAVNDRESAGVQAMKEIVAAQARASEPPLEVRIEKLTAAHHSALSGGLLDVANMLAVQIRDLTAKMAQMPLDPPTAVVEDIGGILGRSATAMEEF